jgi:rubrerythrin
METTLAPDHAPDRLPLPSRHPLRAAFLKRIVRAPEGRAFLLGFLAYAEAAEEKGVFDALLARVDDPELAKLVRIHRDDETRHAALLQACIARGGITPVAIPPELRIVDRIDRHTGRTARAFVDGRLGVMEAYLVLQVIEERGVSQFPLLAEALRPYDPESAATIERITADERRHVRYAQAISRKYAPDAATLERTLLRYRAAEARAFAEHGAALLRFVTARGLFAAGPVERLFWRGLGRVEALLARA